MKFCVFGATGQTGKPFVQQALDKGHEVKAVVRNPDKLSDIKHEKLEIVSANIFSYEELEKHFSDVDVVVSMLGFSIKSRTITGYSEATKAIVKAMNAHEKKRLILMHSMFTEESSRNQASGFFIRWVLLPMIKPALVDMDAAEKFLQSDDSAKNIEWTTICPPGLKNEPVTEKEFKAEEDVYYIENAASISRADVARYIIKTAEEDLHKKKAVSIVTL